MLKVLKESIIEEAITSLMKKTLHYLQHVFIHRKQTRFFQEKVQNPNVKEAVVQIDFADNYTCFQQDEIQPACWSQEQVTHFPVAIWAKTGENKAICNSYAIVSKVTKGKGPLLEKDMIFVPCNQHSLHWYLLAVFPSKKCILVLDSKSGDFVKSTAFQSARKMMSFLVDVDNTIDVSQWEFYSSKAKEIPQQHNDFDCGVFVCLYARCLASSKTLTQSSIQEFRKAMTLGHHDKVLHSKPPTGFSPRDFSAAEYVKHYYFGRVLEASGLFVKIKFLHKVGANTFD